ncbi:DNA/RNA non-specific endonuclease [Clostridium felsineum]|uniref:DNA/RNA non-specific endonuclease n=1 Tax=Clostridium felsineum TaxID=36839 RepID=UPI0009C6A08B|nr:DNA/RNA non-specific endonuclease [Clostridium felsineum]URZ02826.1 hypothetical protein CLAUR_028600 [Clostridium felsineum]
MATNSQARAQFGAGFGNWWNKVRSGDAYTIGQTTAAVASVLVAPGDVGSAASKVSKVDSLLGKAGTFSKSIAISGIENAKNIINLPGRALNNLGSKLTDLRTVFSEGKGLVGDFTKSVAISSTKNVKNLVALPGKIVDDLGSKFTDLRTALSQGNGLRYAFADAGDGRSIFSRIGKEDIEHVDADKICHDRYIQWSKGEMPGGTADPKVIYGELDALKRPTGIKATITGDMIGTGSPASSSIKPPGFLGGGKGGAGHARGHLLGNQLGGSGKDPRNLVTLYQNPVNTPVMRDFETSVRKAAEEGQTINYSATPIYKENNLMPSGVTLNAVGDGGFQLHVTILNRK